MKITLAITGVHVGFLIATTTRVCLIVSVDQERRNLLPIIFSSAIVTARWKDEAQQRNSEWSFQKGLAEPCANMVQPAYARKAPSPSSST